MTSFNVGAQTRRWIKDRWESLDAPVFGRRVPGTLVVTYLAIAVGLIACLYTTRNGSNLWYADAQSHLTIARRIFDSKSPGFQQLGTVWLPVPHLLLIPFVWWLPMWASGWGACLLGTLCLGASVAALYRISARFGMRRMGRIFVVIFFLANPSVLYTYTTALTEPVLIATMLAAIAGISGWVFSERRLSGGELVVFAGIPAGMSVLSRYEGWALVASGSIFVLWATWRRWHDFRAALWMTFCFAAVPALSAIWWITYNFALYGDPLEFMFGEYSAAAQQQQLSDSGLLATKKNLGMTIWVYGWSVIEAAGVVILILALVGAAVLILMYGLKIEAMVIWLTATPIAFSLLSLYLGQSAIFNDHSLPPGWWNNRFALSAIPFLVLLVGVLIDYVRRLKPIRKIMWTKWSIASSLLIVIFAQNVWWAQDLPNRSAVMAEAFQSERLSQESVEAGEYLAHHYSGGNIIMDETRVAILPQMGIPIDQYYNRATGSLMDRALESPTAHAEWLYVSTELPSSESAPTDMVFRAMRRYPDRFQNYQLVFKNGSQEVYKLVKQ